MRSVGANLSGANLSDAYLSDVNLSNATCLTVAPLRSISRILLQALLRTGREKRCNRSMGIEVGRIVDVCGIRI